MVAVTLTATFTAAGAFTWTAPAGVTSVTVACAGAGGGGGGAAAATGSNGGGGGGGEAAAEPSLAVTPGLAYSGTVGAAGAGGAAGANGTPGGDTSFTGDAAATVTAHGGTAGTAGGAAGAGQNGTGGTGSVNTASAAGGDGDDGVPATSGGGGGGGAGVSATAGFPGLPGAGSTAGAASAGTWPGAAGGTGATTGAAGGGAGSPGGGGGGALSTGTGKAGGGGGAGQVVITWTMSDPVTLSSGTSGGAYTFTAPLGATAVKAEAWGGGGGGYNQQGSSGSVAGSTTFPAGYGGGSITSAASIFDGYVNRPLAITAQVRYWSESVYYPADKQNLPELAGLGAKVYACLKPSRLAVIQGGSALASEQAALAACCTAINGVSGLSWVGVIWQEPTLNGKTGWFGDGTAVQSAPTTPSFPSPGAPVANSQGFDVYVNITGGTVTDVSVNGASVGSGGGVYLLHNGGTIAITYTGSPSWNWWVTPYGGAGGVTEPQASANFIAYHHAYAPTVHSAGIQVSYKPAVSSIAPTIDMFPGTGATGCDSIMVDFYALDFVKAINSTNIFGAGNIEAVADANGLPFGLGEWSLTDGAVVPTPAQWNSYISDLVTGFTNRVNTGRPLADCIFYTGQHPGGPNNVTGPSSFMVPGIQQVSDIFTSAGTSFGGAGGGGGEYAADGSLAVSGLSQYVIVVGAGGAGRGSGANSTVAGDAVTVTAHGGSVATAQSTGGAGGTGSANTTHHSGGAGGGGGGAGGGAGGGGASGGTSAGGGAGSAGTATAGGAGAAAAAGGGPGGAGGGPAGDGSPPAAAPGGGGGGRGAGGFHNGGGADGKITLSNFAIHPACTGGLALAPLALAGGSNVPAGTLALAPLALAGAGTVAGFAKVQNGNVSTGASGSVTLSMAASLAGTLIIAQLAIASLSAATGPAGWARIATQAAGAAAAHCETWMYSPSGDGKTGGNPGGITAAAFTAGTGGIRGHLAEYKSLAPNSVPVLNGTPGTASGGTGTTSFTVTGPAGTSGGDLGVAIFQDFFSATTTGSWTQPAGWANNQAQGAALANVWASDYSTGLKSGAPAATAQFSTSVNQSGWAAIMAVFTPSVTITAAGTLALAPLALAGAGSAVVPPNTVLCNGSVALGPVAFQSPSQAATWPGTPLPVVAEILVNGVWADISSYLYQRDGISITGRGRPDEASTAQPAQCTFTLNNRDGTFSPQNTTGQFYPFLLRNTQIRISVVSVVTPLGAWYTGYRFWGEVPAWPPLWDLSGNDVYVSITACGVLQRMRQSKYSASPLTRYYTNLTTRALAQGQPAGGIVPAGYWPCEDGTSAAAFASGIPGGSPMTWSGTPLLAQDSSVPGSAPFAQLNSSAWTGSPGAFTQGGQTFTTAGTFTWTCPGGITSIKAECWGAGGGGSNGIWGTGGGGGEYATEATLAVTPGKTYTFVIGTGGGGGGGSFTSRGLSGSSGGDTTFAGDTVTVRAHGGKGGPSASSGHANGGSGSANTTHHSGGSGAANDAGNGGSGGGSSAGSAANGNTGGTSGGDPGGSGGAAVPDGGPGGAGGLGHLQSEGRGAMAGLQPVPGPGGGGGGGGFSGYNNYGEPGGGGAAGQVRISFGAAIPAPSAVVLRAVIDVPATGGVDGSYLVQALSSGTVADLHIKYHTGGNLEIRGNNASGGNLFTSGSKAFGANGQPLLISAELTQKTATTIAWKLTAIKPGATAVVATYTGTVTGTLGSVTQVKTNSTAPVETGATGVGHISVQYAVDPILNLSQALAAYAGELAATRFVRLCTEQNVPAVLSGNATDTPQMGAQPAGLLVDLLQDCEAADLGQMFELRTAFGLGYRTRASLQNQAAAVVLDYALAQLSPPLVPTNDDQLTRNDIIATRANGGTSYEAIQSTGPLSVQDPPNGVGLYQYTVTPNLFTDSQLAAFATWLLTLGTLDEFRYPQITADLRRSTLAGGTFGAMAALDIGGFLQIINPPPWLPQTPINQLAFGISETLDSVRWVIVVNAVPEDPYSSASSGSGSNDAAPFPTW